MTFNIFSSIYLAYLLSRYSYVPNIASFQFWEKLPNYERHSRNPIRRKNIIEVISLENSIIILRHISCAQVHLSSERNEGRAIRFMHERSFYGSEFPSFFFRDNGLFLTRGASQNLRKRCHGKLEEETGGADITLELWVMYFVHGEASFSKTASRCDEEEKIKIGFPLRGLAGSIEEWMVWCGQFVMALPPSSSG